MKLNARVGRNKDGNYHLKVANFSIITMKTRSQAEAVRDVVRQNMVMLTEYTRRDLTEMAGFHRSQCVSDQKNKRIGITWGQNRTDEWLLIPKPQVVIEHEDVTDDIVMESEPVKVVDAAAEAK